MAITPAKRKQMEKIIYDTFSALDKTGENTKKYKAQFSKMSDAQFDSFFKRLFSEKNAYLVLDVIDYERDINMQDIEDASNVLGVPLMEKVALPFLSRNPNQPVISKQEVPVGYIHLKRTQQMQFKKNTTSTDISTRSALTGQVTGADKNARESDAENFVLVTIGSDKAIKEFCSARADDMVMKSEMYSEIAKKGYVSMDELTDDVRNKTTLNTVDTFMLGMGLKTDLVTGGLELKNFDKK